MMTTIAAARLLGVGAHVATTTAVVPLLVATTTSVSAGEVLVVVALAARHPLVAVACRQATTPMALPVAATQTSPMMPADRRRRRADATMSRTVTVMAGRRMVEVHHRQGAGGAREEGLRTHRLSTRGPLATGKYSFSYFHTHPLRQHCREVEGLFVCPRSSHI